MATLDKQRLLQQAITTTANLGTIVAEGGMGTLKPGLDYFRFELGTFDEALNPETYARQITISNNHEWDYLYNDEQASNLAYIYGDTSNSYYLTNEVKILNSGNQQTKNRFLKNYFYCVGTRDFRYHTESSLTEADQQYINDNYKWKKFNGSITVPLDTSCITYVWMIGSNVWTEDDTTGYTIDAFHDKDNPIKGNWSANSERLNFCVLGSTESIINVQDIVNVAGAYGSLCWGTSSENWYTCPNENSKCGYGNPDSSIPEGPHITFKNTKLNSASSLYLFNDSQPYCYSGLFDGSTITAGPTIGTNLSERIKLQDYSCCQMFKNCKRLKTYSFNNNINISGEGCLKEAFINCTALTSAYIPVMLPTETDGQDGLGVDVLNRCFENCSQLTSVTLDLSPNNAKPSNNSYEYAARRWFDLRCGIFKLFYNAGPLTSINKLNIKNIDNAVTTRTDSDGILYLYGNNGAATNLYYWINTDSLKDGPFSASVTEVTNVFKNGLKIDDTLYFNYANWKLQINGSDYIYKVASSSGGESDSTEFVKFGLRTNGMDAYDYITFSVPAGSTWNDLLNNYDSSSDVYIRSMNGSKIYLSKYNGLNSYTFPRGVVGFSSAIRGDYTNIGNFSTTIEFAAICPSSTRYPVDPSEEIKNHIYIVNNDYDNSYYMNYGTTANLNRPS